MFSGIVESTTQLKSYKAQETNVVIGLSRPSFFSDIKIGDSIAVNGVCLTVDQFTDEDIQFVLGAETVKVTCWTEEFLSSRTLNLERSLKPSDRNHGHIVTGHVDEMGRVAEKFYEGESLHLNVSFSYQLRPFIWQKGSITINGVSLTVNSIDGDSLNVCLIPETLRRTNLESLEEGTLVCLEVDNLARGLVHNIKLFKDSIEDMQ